MCPSGCTNHCGMRFRLIPPGEFLMGSTPTEVELALFSAGVDKYWEKFLEAKHPSLESF